MSSGRTHQLVNVMALIIPATAALAWFFGDYSIGKWQSIATLAGGYFLSTVGINPDQDIGGSRIFAERRGLWGSFLYYWSLPYGFMFRHRGISHEHIIGTITRVLFMGLWILPAFPILVIGIEWRLVAEYSGWAFLGLTVADSMHIAADGGRKQREHQQSDKAS